jgi:putative ABC transport system permease protein
MADDSEVDREIEEHLELLTQRYISQGMTVDAARRAARLQFGNLTQLREDRYRLRTILAVEALWRDARHAARMCRRNPGFTAAVVLTLALGIGANTAIFTICNAILLRPLPYHDPDRLVMLWERPLGSGDSYAVAPANFLDWRAQTHSFESVAAINPFPTFVLRGPDKAELLRGAAISWDFFALLGTQLSMGRSFLAEEDQPGVARVAILTHDTWEIRFGARRDILGAVITLNDVPHTVVGVLPRDFEFIARSTDFQSRTAFDVWVPIAIRANPSRGTHPLRVFARLKPDVTVDQARADLDVVGANLARAYPEENKDRGIAAVPLFEQVTRDMRPALFTLLGAVGFVLLIACGNVANLLLSRGATRQRELLVRLAIGAGLGRVAQQLLVESICLALLGGALGVCVAIAAIRLVAPYLPVDVARATSIGIDLRVMSFTTVVSMITGLLCALAPLLHATRVNPGHALVASGARVVSGLHTRLRSSLVLGQVAITLVLSIGAALMAKSLWTLLQAPTGFTADNVLTARITLPRSRYPDPGRIAAFHREVLDLLRASPGVQAAGMAAYLPFSGDDNGWAFRIEGRPPLPVGVYTVAKYRPISDGYLEALGMPLIRGRGFNPSDTENAAPTVVINQSMARMYWGEDDPLGQRLQFGGGIWATTWRTIVGVVGDVRHEGLDRDLTPEMYVPFAQAPQPEGVATLVIRTPLDAAAMAGVARSVVAESDASVPIDRLTTMDQLVSASVGTPRFQTIMLAGMALLALAMASIGIYGVTSYTVAQRTREFGLCLALGASSGTILRRVLAQSVAMIGGGLTVGLAASLVLTRLTARLLYGVTPLDPLTFAMVPVLLFVVACLATYLPARRATSVNPIVALRVD